MQLQLFDFINNDSFNLCRNYDLDAMCCCSQFCLFSSHTLQHSRLNFKSINDFQVLWWIYSNSCIIYQEGQTCVDNHNCDSDLHCEACVADGNIRPHCTRIQPLNPFSKVNMFIYIHCVSECVNWWMCVDVVVGEGIAV